MSWTVGRAGRDTGLGTIETEEANLQGNTLSLVGSIVGDDEADVMALRQQLLGIIDSPDEPVVPITNSDDGTFDGFYRATSLEVPGPRVAQLQGALYWRGTFERIDGFAQPAIETVLVVPGMVNSHGVTSTEYDFTLGLPVNTLEFSGTGFSTTYRSRIGDEGAVPLNWVDAATPQRLNARWSCSAANYYLGACRFAVGTDYHQLSGRQVDNDILGPDLDRWRISNSLVRMEWSQASAVFYVTHHDGGTWQTPKNYIISRGTSLSVPLTQIVAVRVLRNTPEHVIVRLAMRESAFNFGNFYSVDLSLRRGDYGVMVTVNTDIAIQLTVGRGTPEAGTALSSSAPFTSSPGLRATNNDADGNRYVLFTRHAQTSNTGSGYVESTASLTQHTFFISNAIAGSSAASPDTPEVQVVQLLSGASDRMVVSSR